MFWGVTLESGKRYSQKVSESYHLSMACLEPLHGSTKPADGEVAVMLEHGESEYALCVLEYGRVMQANLDIIFDCGEIVTYFLKGEGVVHLTGYALAETEDASEAKDKINDILALNVDEGEDEEDDEDWIPSKEKEHSDTSDGEGDDSEEEDSNSDGEPDVLTKIENDIDQNQLSETNEDEADDAPRKRKIVSVKGNKAKKQKLNDSPPAENGGGISGKVKSKKKSNIGANHVNAEDPDYEMSGEEESEDDSDDASAEDNNIDYSSEDQEVSSVGNTPMPKKKVSSKTGLGESPDLPRRQKKQKTKLKARDVSSPNKGSVPVTPKNARKLRGNIQVEDLRTGSGPLAKNGKFVSVNYLGKLSNGKVFESCEAPKKPFTFRLGKGDVIKGLDIGVEGMKVGGKRRITIPPNMGYGSQKVELIPPNSTLIFTVELKLVR